MPETSEKPSVSSSEELHLLGDNKVEFERVKKESGHGCWYVCPNCGWQWQPLDLTSGVVDTRAGQAISSRICPGCGKVGRSLKAE